MSEMRIITLWQPWASLIALGLKQYETRSRNTNYRGRLAIHASKRPFVNADGSKTLDKIAWFAWLDAMRLAEEAGIINDQSRLPFAHQLPLGSIVAIADLTNCQKMISISGYETPREIGVPAINSLEKAVGDWRPGRYAWKLENVRPLDEAIPYRGRQGLRVLDNPAALRSPATLLAIAGRLGGVVNA